MIRAKIKPPQNLRAIAAKAAKAGRKVVFTNGCFDLLHKGHVAYLERARALGDILIVALNTDASVKRLKGPDRPLNALADRLEVIAALESVSYATWFDEDDPIKLIRSIRPKILVKGGDWRPEQILGSEDVLSWGGKVKSLPFIKGRSTTQLIEKARQNVPLSSVK